MQLYSSLSEIPEGLKVVEGVPVTLSQANLVGLLAQEVHKQADIDWQIDTLKVIYEIRGNAWVENNSLDGVSFASVEKKEDGSYWITAISTAALKDRDDETFTTQAIDYDIEVAEITGKYPEFRVFHDNRLGFGQVEKMSRVGIFAVDEGSSYDDPFSISVCEKMLANNSFGKWKVSRGFFPVEVSGYCPQCNAGLVVNKSHLATGFRCPKCESVYLTYKRVFKDVSYRKARTFDITVTDIPCVPWTGISATQKNISEEKSMKKDELKKRLIAAGLPEDQVDARLAGLKDEQLKELDDIPEAELKEMFADDDASDDGGTFSLDPEVITAIGKEVRTVVADLMDGIQIEIAESKEVETAMAEFKETLAALTEKVDALLEADHEKVQKEVRDLPRSEKLRIRRFKTVPVTKSKKDPAADNSADDEDMEDMMDNQDDEEAENETNKEFIISGDGTQYPTMTDMVLGQNGRKPKK